MSCAEEYTPQLRARGYRMTPQRLAILHVLKHVGGHLTPVQIFKKASKQLHGLTEPTVYRTLEFLAENSLIHSAQNEHGRMTYEIAAHLHHHIRCRVCGAEMEVDHQLLQNIYRNLATSSGYKMIQGHITFLGICPSCQ